MFSECLNRRRRCVVLVDGFYEWKTEESKSGSGKKSTKKQPYFIFHGSEEDDECSNLSQNAKVDSSNPEKSDASSGTNGKVDIVATHSASSTSPPSKLLAMAGLFCVAPPRAGEGRDPKNPLYSYSIITVPSSSTMNWLHHR